jgi:Mn-containing catalase
LHAVFSPSLGLKRPAKYRDMLLNSATEEICHIEMLATAVTLNLESNMYCNVAAKAKGRVLAVRLHNATDDPDIKKMLAFNIARDTMHQQRLAVLEELGPSLSVPTSFPQSPENRDYSYKFFITTVDKQVGNQEGQPGRPVQRQMDMVISNPSSRARLKVLVSPISASSDPTPSVRRRRHSARQRVFTKRARTWSPALLIRIS